MKLVSSQESTDIDRSKADAEVTHKLRALAANILRCCAGGGKDYMLENQCAEFLIARRKQAEAHGFSQMLNAPYKLSATVALEDHRDWVKDGSHAHSDIADAAMQMHASYLLDQMTQVRTAENRLHAAIRNEGYERVRPR